MNNVSIKFTDSLYSDKENSESFFISFCGIEIYNI